MDLTFDPSVDFKLLLAVPLIPLIGYVINIFFGEKLPGKGAWMLTGGMFVVMCITLYMFAKMLHAHAEEGVVFSWSSALYGMGLNWFYSGELQPGNPGMPTGILYDTLGAAMLAVVGVVAFCVHLFSIGYMKGDRRFRIFFSNISLFSFAMLGLVLSDNLLFLFIFWEIMGLMSYLLIGHFAHDPTSPRITQASSACKKAFLTTRVGDVCLLLGGVMFYYHFETFNFAELWRMSIDEVAANGGEWPAWMNTAGFLIFGGTVGKSAQFPLHIWLPDAMEGPTPVSAMIHAATMVAAGVFLLGRTYPLMSPEVLATVAIMGSITALFAATIGTTVNDIKGVLAYSTISQLGFMVAAVGLGGVVAGMFHMVTHAFFKACLFLSAGSVIHGCHHEQDMRKMGGLSKIMPITFGAMLVSTFAIAGLPGFSGFYSKDMIVQYSVLAKDANWTGATMLASYALPIAAALTAFYMFRLIFMTFTGEYRGGHDDHGHEAHGDAAHDAPDDSGHDDHDDHGGGQPHESPWPITSALVILGLLGIFAGKFMDPIDVMAHHEPWFARVTNFDSLYGAGFVNQTVESQSNFADWKAARTYDPETLHHAHGQAVKTSLTVAGLGILLAALLYWAAFRNRLIGTLRMGWLRGFTPARIVKLEGPIYPLVCNKYYIDQIVNLVVIKPTMALASLLKLADEKIVDGYVNLNGRIGKLLGFFAAWFDRTFVDGFVNFVGLVTQAFGAIVRLLQTGRIQQYVTFAVAGGVLAAAWLILA
jgi:NADH-quinone oxidoreductase subunit L